ncbi:MAG: cytochrome c biogenesis protein CcsA [Chloroflexi bacterium]|nr:cytochrome c biogenesis protein CcsA [Chloroflexota bacterium]
MKRGILLAASFVLMMATLYLVFLYAPIEKEMGIVQKIFYLMVPMGWLALLSFVITFIGSILYLTKKAVKWDILGHSAAEVGIVFTTLALATGSIWAKPIWGVWWDWGTPRLTSTLVLWLIYIAYFMVRGFATEEHRGATFAAIVGIVGFFDVPLIILSTTLWRGLHPPLIIFQEGGLDPRMRLALMASIVAFTLLYVLLVNIRVSIRNNETELRRLKELSD